VTYLDGDADVGHPGAVALPQGADGAARFMCSKDVWKELTIFMGKR
jgi:hypothetical protein